jgi:hypothetical protein
LCFFSECESRCGERERSRRLREEDLEDAVEEDDEDEDDDVESGKLDVLEID